jgi:hypothetical protein
MVVEYILDSLRVRLLEIFLVAVFAVVFLRHILRNNQSKATKKLLDFVSYGRLAVLLIFFRLLYASFMTAAQYFYWLNNPNPALRIFATSPLDPSVPLPWIFSGFRSLLDQKYGYYIHYAFGRFWLNFFITIGFCLVFWFFMVLLKKYRERFFEEGEPELGLVVALIVGWPGVVVYVPLVFLFVVIISVFKALFLREKYTTMAWPFLFSGIITILIGQWILTLWKLAITLKI